MQQTLYWIGIRCEDKSVWQRRTPLIPKEVKEVLEKYPHLRIKVQPSKKRIFSDAEYQQAGAILDENINDCSLILGIKEVPIHNFIAGKTFVYFSHTIKAQPSNMACLDTIIKQNIRLVDYQRIVNEKNQRLIAFGKYAGIAGAIDFLKGFGEYIMLKGISTPFLHCNTAYKYFDINDAYTHLKTIGKKIQEKEIPKELSPMIFAVTGRGRTAQGCIQVLQNLPVTHLKPSQLPALWADRQNPKHRKTVYLMSVNTEDCMQPHDPNSKYDKQDFYKNPGKYRCNFNTKFLPYISALYHCIYWEPGFPKYIENKDIYELAKNNQLRLLGVCDVTCDLDGSVECLQDYTQPEKPFFYYDSIEDQNTFDSVYKNGKVLYLAIDFLPCELAYDASCHFSRLLKNWVDPLARSDKNKPIEQQEKDLPSELFKAIITANGKLTPNYEYIAKMRQQNENKSITSKKKQENGRQFDKSNSVMQHNVTKVENIKGEALDFTK